MRVRTRLTSVDELPERGSYLFTVVEPDGSQAEVFLVRCETDDAADADDEDDAGDVGDRTDDGRADGGQVEDGGVEAADGERAGDDVTPGPGVAAGDDEELPRDQDGSSVRAWRNFCLHETDQRLDRGVGDGVAMRDGEIICPRHGSAYDACSGHCDEGKAAGTDLIPVDVEIEDGEVYLTDDDLRFDHEGGIEDGDGPGSTSHINF
jgi:nitrite reductase/ring-hydroxylating ferredoxin subunit